MFLLLAGFVIAECRKDAKNCLSCIEENSKDDNDCGWCWSESKCYEIKSANYTKCAEKDSTRTKKCVEQLGGDAKDSVRYAVGFTILAVAIVVDVVVRIMARRQSVDEYSHL